MTTEKTADNIVFDECLSFEVFGVGIQVQFDSPEIKHILLSCYNAFVRQRKTYALSYRIKTFQNNGGYEINSYSLDLGQPRNKSDLVYSFEKDIELQLQRLCAEWFFIHGAALLLQDKVIILMAPSGNGKSTLTWGLLNHGFTYFSDELAPVELDTLRVKAYPCALCLKSHPPGPIDLPPETLRLERTMYVPVKHLPGSYSLNEGKASAIFFVEYDSEIESPEIRPLTPGESAAHLYANGLNQLAHSNRGLSAAATIAQNINAFGLKTTSNLAACADLVVETLRDL